MPLEYEKISPVKYKINAPTEKFVIFTENYNKNWQLGKQEPINLGPVNAYEYENNSNLNYKRFRAYLASYIASFLFLAVMLGYLFVNRKIYILM